MRDTFRGPLLTMGAIKAQLDGTVDAQTAVMFDPYVGTANRGIPFWEPEELNQTVALYDKLGFQLMLHAIGDRAISDALDAFAYARATNGTSGRRHRIEHAEVPRLDDLKRFRRLNVIASTQAMFANPDATVLENFDPLLGRERAPHADSFALFDDAGLVQAFGSDWPVFSYEPLRGIFVAVNRTTPEGKPVGGWHPQGRISVEAALRHYTIDGAYASFDEDIRGSLSAGKLADFVVLSKDLRTIPPEQILSAEVLLTVMGGRETFRSEAF
jgi:predicted amidohydrolase YtcJ